VNAPRHSLRKTQDCCLEEEEERGREQTRWTLHEEEKGRGETNAKLAGKEEEEPWHAPR
jgi:hypothetical protein